MATQRVKVRVADLVTRIEARKVANQADFEAEKVEYANAVAEYHQKQAERERGRKAFRKACAARMREVAKDMAAGGVESELDETYDYNTNRYQVNRVIVRLPFKEADYVPDEPTEPREPFFDPSQYDQDVELLKMSADDTISISTSDRWARYL